MKVSPPLVGSSIWGLRNPTSKCGDKFSPTRRSGRQFAMVRLHLPPEGGPPESTPALLSPVAGPGTLGELRPAA